MRHASLNATVAVAALLAGCAHHAELPVAAGTGPSPALPSPTHRLVPTVRVAEAAGWAPGTMPTSAAGTKVVAFATGLSHPRWLHVLPNGDVLVAETNAPPRPDDGKGIKGWFFKRYQKKAGGTVPSANRITLLRDTNRDGVSDLRTAFLNDLNSPFGMALVGDWLYIANTDAVVRVPYREGATHIAATPAKVAGSVVPTPKTSPARKRPSQRAASAPTIKPAAISASPWLSTERTTCSVRAPSAIRMPISCRRCTTM